ncbi:hypothetical protein [Opitutus sp. ER46]|uniref:hypothetical protein n=1 Tax=Opitutus sp. ER46 TaxID=2161864 RepID=UPI000D31E25D|nr:hypothetical protein [Opitutus sp. ER46]PTX95556.1 hypothetical protein DB354_09035 [Opitutus sp. ER46]
MRVFAGRRWTQLVLLVIPIAFVLVALGLARQRGPLWLGQNSDPSYQYLFSSLLLLNGQTPCHVDHPGTPLQVLGAAVLQQVLPGQDTLAESAAALRDPERALAAIHRVLVGITALSFTLAGFLVAARTGRVSSGVVVQAIPLLQIEPWRATLFIAPEALLLPLTLLVVALTLVRDLPTEAPPSARPTLLSIVLGFVAGAALVTKVNFLPLCLLPLLTTRSRRQSLWTGGAMAVSVILFLLPIATQVPRMLRWLFAVSTHTGFYGSGDAGMIDAATYLPQLTRLIVADPVLLVVIVLSGAVGLRLVRSNQVPPGTRVLARLLLITTVVEILAVLMVAKHPRPHYLLPAMVAAALNIGLMLELMPRTGPTGRQASTRLAWAAAMLVTGLFAAWRLTDFAHELGAARDRQLASAAGVPSRGDALRVEYYRCSSPTFALYFGNGSAWGMFGPMLSELYPGRVFFNRFTGTYDLFSGPTRRDALPPRARILLVGDGAIEQLPGRVTPPQPAGAHLRVVQRTADQVVHEIVGSDP